MRRKEHGAVAVVVAIVIALLLGFLGLSLETGHVLSVRGELQNGADAAALAGARRLNGTNENFELAGARTDATNFARAHPTDVYDVEPFTIQLGHWAAKDESCGTFGGVDVPASESPPSPDGHHFCHIAGTTAADALNITAVRVVTRRQGSPGGKGGGAVAHPFGAILDKPQSDVAAEAIAITGSPAPPQGEGCPEWPFAIKVPCVKLPDDCGKLFFVGLASSVVDSGGLTVFQEATCGGSTGTDEKMSGGSGWGVNQDLCPIINETCVNEEDLVGKCISVKNGSSVNANCAGDAKACYKLRDKVGKIGQLPLVRYEGDETCSFSTFNYTHAPRVEQIGTAQLVAAKCDVGSDKQVNAMAEYAQEAAKCDFASGSCFVLKFLCDQTDDDEASISQTWSGTTVLEPALVR